VRPGLLRTRLLVLLLAVGAAFAFAGAAPSAPPPGATALCRDGTYSFSKHHSGTCSYHGGVAKWLDGSSANGGTRVNVGQTVLLASRTATSGCRLGPNPDRRCSPGAYYSKLTKRVICGAGFSTSSIRNVPQSEKFAVEREYGLAAARYARALEIDHIVSLELGGSNDIANLFPEKLDAAPGYRVKDRLENKVHDWVCAGKIALRPAQRQIASNWQALYRKVFGVAPA
jgi:hypothetical protein